MHITFVKKIKADGLPCRKCAEVEDRLRAADLMDAIDATVVADERDPASEGMRLARQYQVDLAPFFVVLETDGGTPRIYTSYFRLLKEVLNRTSSEQDEIGDIMREDDSLDYL